MDWNGFEHDLNVQNVFATTGNNMNYSLRLPPHFFLITYYIMLCINHIDITLPFDFHFRAWH